MPYLVNTTRYLCMARPVTARFGTASLPQEEAKTGQDLFRHADQRLRAASSPP